MNLDWEKKKMKIRKIQLMDDDYNINKYGGINMRKTKCKHKKGQETEEHEEHEKKQKKKRKK